MHIFVFLQFLGALEQARTLTSTLLDGKSSNDNS
jgi:hypothetical protein